MGDFLNSQVPPSGKIINRFCWSCKTVNTAAIPNPKASGIAFNCNDKFAIWQNHFHHSNVGDSFQSRIVNGKNIARDLV